MLDLILKRHPAGFITRWVLFVFIKIHVLSPVRLRPGKNLNSKYIF